MLGVFAAEKQKLYSSTKMQEGFVPSNALPAQVEILNAATHPHDLAVLPGNRLEALKAERKGQYSIRINDQYRICFRWKNDGEYEVEIVDYH